MAGKDARMGGKTVLSTMKNEGAFLVDWAAHHLALGFDRMVICTNDCADPTVAMVQRLEAMGLARHHATRPWPRTSMQRSALKQARRYPEVAEADWVYTCDADEFLAIRLGDGSVDALIAAASPECEVISVAWRVFGPDGREAYEDIPVSQQFTRGQAMPARIGLAPPSYCKSLARGDLRVQRPGIHAPIPDPALGRPFVTEMPGGCRHTGGNETILVWSDWRAAQVNHYALRSAESFLVKRERGRVNHTEQAMNLDYWDRFDIAQERCDLIRRHADRSAECRERLMADDELRILHIAAVNWHRAKIAELKQNPDYAETVAGIAERQGRCLRLAS